MDQAIAIEWGRFLRDVEATQRADSPDDNGGTASQTGKSSVDNSKQAVLQRLENALAVPAPADEPLYCDPAASSPAYASGESKPDSPDDDRLFLEHFARTAAATEDRRGWLKTSPADASSVLEPKRAATSEVGVYSTQLHWTSTGFEERRVFVPPPAEAPASETQITATSDDTLAQAPAITSDETPEGNMWKSVAQADTAVSSEPAITRDEMLAVHVQDASRWYVLKGVLGGATALEETANNLPAAEIPVLEVFSTAGGVGKTSLVATLGRALSARGERVLLVEATPFGTLPFFFGTCDCRPDTLRTFRPPASSSDAPIRLATVDTEALAPDSSGPGSLTAKIEEWATGVSRVIVDVATRSTATARELARVSPVVLVPLVPDVNSVIAANSIDSFFHGLARASGAGSDVYYVLNQFDPSLPLHQDVRKALRDRLGERLLPFAFERTPAISEALAEGMTIMDYAPDSAAAADFTSLAKWLENVLAPADVNLRGIRWSER